jgi:hypothetical protein
VAVEKALFKVLKEDGIPNAELVEQVAVAKIKAIEHSFELLNKLMQVSPHPYFAFP